MRKFTLLFLSLLLSLTVGLAQQRVITGVVLLAPDNEPAIGASILVKEHTRSGVLVGTDGKFKITVPAGSKTFRISFIYGIQNRRSPHQRQDACRPRV